MTINDYTTEAINRFLLYLQNCRRSQNTIRSYRADLFCFASWIKKDTRLPLITTKLIRDFISSSLNGNVPYSRRKSSPSTCNRRLSSLRVFFTWLTLEGMIFQNPSTNIDFIPCKKKLSPWLTREQIANLLYTAKRISPLNYMIFYILYHTAIRRSELCTLTISDLNFTTHTVTIHGKGEKIRYIPLLKEEMKPIQHYLSENPYSHSSGPLLLTEQNKPLKSKFIYDRITRISAMAHIPCVPHTLRRSRATHLINAGMPIECIRDLLGHSSVTTTECYAMIPHDAIRRAYDRIAPQLL